MSTSVRWNVIIHTAQIDGGGTDAKITFTLLYQNRKDPYRNDPQNGWIDGYRQGKDFSYGNVSSSTQQGNILNVYMDEDLPDGEIVSGLIVAQDNTGDRPGWAIDMLELIPYAPNGGLLSPTPTALSGMKAMFNPPAWIADGEDGAQSWRIDGKGPIVSVSREFKMRFGSIPLPGYEWLDKDTPGAGGL